MNDNSRPGERTPISPAPVPYRGSGAPCFMLPEYRRRRNVGRK